MGDMSRFTDDARLLDWIVAGAARVRRVGVRPGDYRVRFGGFEPSG